MSLDVDLAQACLETPVGRDATPDAGGDARATLFTDEHEKGRQLRRPLNSTFFDYALRSGAGVGTAGGATGFETSVDGPEPGAMVIVSPGLCSG